MSTSSTSSVSSNVSLYAYVLLAKNGDNLGNFPSTFCSSFQAKNIDWAQLNVQDYDLIYLEAMKNVDTHEKLRWNVGKILVYETLNNTIINARYVNYSGAPKESLLAMLFN